MKLHRQARKETVLPRFYCPTGAASMGSISPESTTSRPFGRHRNPLRAENSVSRGHGPPTGRRRGGPRSPIIGVSPWISMSVSASSTVSAAYHPSTRGSPSWLMAAGSPMHSRGASSSFLTEATLLPPPLRSTCAAPLPQQPELLHAFRQSKFGPNNPDNPLRLALGMRAHHLLLDFACIVSCPRFQSPASDGCRVLT